MLKYAPLPHCRRGAGGKGGKIVGTRKAALIAPEAFSRITEPSGEENLHVRVPTGTLDGWIIPAWYNGNSIAQRLTT